MSCIFAIKTGSVCTRILWNGGVDEVIVRIIACYRYEWYGLASDHKAFVGNPRLQIMEEPQSLITLFYLLVLFPACDS